MIFQKLFYFVFTIIFCFSTSNVFSQPLPKAKPSDVGFSTERLDRVHPIIEDAIKQGYIPGAVLLVAKKGKVVLRKAYGHSQVTPTKKKMQPEMIFDLASITKPMATATSIMILVEQGKIRIQDRVKEFVPDFAAYQSGNGSSSRSPRLYHLMTHTSGLPPYYNADSLQNKYGYVCSVDSAVAFMGRLTKSNAPGDEFHYSCLGFITQADIIKQVSGMDITEFSRKHIFEPLGLKHTGFIKQVDETVPDPQNHLVKKYSDLIVPTEVLKGKPLKGTVHDPLARTLGGISGNAGLFSNADDMAIFAQMFLNGGIYNSVRILSPLAVKLMTSIYPTTKEAGRGLGWDISSAYSSNGGDLFPPGGFGHTGYTGTSIWISPATETFVILLTNRVHPKDEHGSAVVRLRSRVANIVASSIM